MDLSFVKILNTTKWSGGITKQIYIYPSEAIFSNHDFIYRVSSAEVELEQSNFTFFENYTRYILSLDNPLEIVHNNQKALKLEPLQVHEFRGDDETISYGKCSDFNLMVNKDYQGRIGVIKTDIIDFDSGHTIIYAFSGAVSLEIDSKEQLIEGNTALVIKSIDPISIKALKNAAVYAHVEI